MSIAKFVNQVFVGKGIAPSAASDIDALAVGSVVVLDEKNAAPSATSKRIRVIKVTDKKNVVLPDGTRKEISVVHTSDLIDKATIFTPVVEVKAYTAPSANKVTIDFTGATVPADANRIAVKVMHKDIEGAKMRITKTYDYVAGTIVLADAFKEIARKINKYSGHVLTATVTGTTLVIEGLDICSKDLNAIDEFYMPEFDAVAYFSSTDVSMKLESVDGLTVTRVAANLGAGDARLVRDAEKTGLAYQGNVSFTHFPAGKPGLSVDMNKTYDTVVVEYNPVYRSSNNQALETTPRSVNIYVEAGTGENIIAGFNLATESEE